MYATATPIVVATLPATTLNATLPADVVIDMGAHMNFEGDQMYYVLLVTHLPCGGTDDDHAGWAMESDRGWEVVFFADLQLPDMTIPRPERRSSRRVSRRMSRRLNRMHDAVQPGPDAITEADVLSADVMADIERFRSTR